MSPMNLICRTCGDACLLADDVMMRECPSCGTVICRPAEGDVSDMLSRATGQRLRCDFVHAENSYQYVLRESPEEHEALWGLVQCRYGVEYVKDPRTGKPMPIVHAVRRRPMLTDPDFREACDLAPEAVRAQYRQEAEYIDGAMARILDLAEKGEAYDVFLCHKTSRTDGEEGYTEDFKRATDLYIMLRELGYRVFFAPFAGLTPGENYEAGIYHALTTSKVMLVICSNADYINSPWVRTEWQRFLEMSYEDGADKHLIPLLYEGFLPRRLPDDFRQLQAITMGELNAKDSLVAAMEKYAGAAKAEPEVKKPEPAQSKPAQPAPQPVPVQPEPMPKTEPKEGQEKPAAQPAPVQKPVQPESAPSRPRARKPHPTYAPEDDFRVKAVDGGVTITKYYGYCRDGELLIPPMIGGKRVVAIGDTAFDGRSQLNKVVIPKGVTSIGNWAFRNCSSLTSMSIPEGLTSIGGWAFEGCSGLMNVSLPASVVKLDRNPFAGCKALTSITVAAENKEYYARDGVLLSRDQEVVCYLAGLNDKSYTVPAGVTSIGDGAFYKCSSLMSVEIPANVTSIGYLAFCDCSSLTSVEFPVSLTSIGDNAFYNCSGLTCVNIPEGVTSIGNFAFGDCSGLTRVTIPARASIGNKTFEGCTNLPFLQKMKLKMMGAM